MSCIQRRWRSIQLHLVKSKKLVHYTLELHEIIKYIIINFLFYFISQTMFLYIYNKWRIFYGAEGLESRLKNRVVRWAAGYNVVRVRQSDRRFKFSQYPDSKILTTSRHEIIHLLFEITPGTCLKNAYHTTMFAFTSCIRVFFW